MHKATYFPWNEKTCLEFRKGYQDIADICHHTKAVAQSLQKCLCKHGSKYFHSIERQTCFAQLDVGHTE